jgi:hypothetical protein
MANRPEQLRLTRCVVLCGNLHPCVLRNFSADRAGGRRDRSGFDGADGDVRDDETLVIPSGLYRRPDRLERHQNSARVRDAAHRSVGHRDAVPRPPAVVGLDALLRIARFSAE